MTEGSISAEDARRALAASYPDFAYYGDHGQSLLIKGFEQGYLCGLAKGMLKVFAQCEIAVPEQVREQIMACEDIPTLEAWFHRALDAGSVEELFSPSHPLRAEQAQLAGGADGEPDLGERGA
ncbi:hypothetical protein [Nonomuraea jiangxiensis]|uniref:Uncharacterized protein n=1 Tax=Nonomuraea jiangxiensis TaxID=633440 RepID=A0A1G9SFC1_9ACTN|nr:hypothetical protein [Nonomuraea jiangxiensis]SDM34040.1 hypothetical protein SAMN05421869_14141 [Nonomuraea jiangxiensis]